MAIDWHSAHMLARNADSFSKLLHAFVGLYLWEWFNSLDFEYKLITGRHKFKWPLFFYFLNRYSLLGVCIGFLIFLDTMIDSSDCEAIYVFIQAMGSLSMGLACVNLAIRTIAIWKNDRHVVVGLTIIILGHWAIILRDIPIVRAMWDDNQGCIFIDNKHNLVTGIYVYAMGIDFIVMCLMAYKTGIQLNNRTRLIKILVVDGVLYFIIAFLVNLMGVVFSALNLNPIMSVIGVVPATMISTIAACRAVRHLTTFVNRPNRLNIIEISQPISEGVSICGVEQQRSTLAETRPCPCITLPVPVKIMDGSKSPCSDTSDDTLARSPTGSEFV